MKRRILAVALAIVLAILGTAGVLAYVHKADTRAIEGMKAVTVLVAQQQVASGTSASTALQNGSLKGQELPASAVPSDAVRSLTPGLGSLVLSSTLQPGQLLLRPMLVTTAQATATGALAIPKGMVAVSLWLCMPEAVAGYVQPGSDVAVFDTYGKSLTPKTCGQPHQPQPSAHTRIVLPRTLVLSMGNGSAGGSSLTSAGSAASQSDPSAATGLVQVTLAVDQADAERVILIAEAGLPYLALLTPASVTHFDTAPIAPLFQP